MRSHHVAVVDLERVAPSLVANGATLHALSTALLEDAAAESAHDFGVEAGGTSDALRMGRCGIEDALGTGGNVVRQILACRHAREAGSECMKRRGPGRNGAAVGAAAIGVKRLMQN